MALACTWQFVLPLFLLLGTLSQSYPIRLELHRRFTSEILEILDAMGGAFPVLCREQGMQIKSLDLMEIAKNAKAEDKVMIFYQILRHTSKIYRTNVCSTMWDKNGLDEFAMLLFQQLKELRQDLGERQSGLKIFGRKRIRTYFRKLRTFLQNKGYNRCAWEMIRNESRKNLEEAISLLV
ncbi:interferon beta-like [Rhincodon typus]|uniref:interferon beta-like n=1 Tax=Rhincodon typus TaxID=259920 RepID=UPI0009A4036F|nr:interferon beta-like [Rhincodon typus]